MDRSDDGAGALDARWRPALLAFFRRRLNDHDLAEDLTQETLLRLVRATEQDERGDAFVFRIAQNLLIDHTRRRQVRGSYARSIAADPTRDHDAINPERIVQSREQLTRLTTALADLPDRTRAIFILYRIESLSQDEIGAAFGISASAVKQQIAKAMAHLARRMRDVR